MLLSGPDGCPRSVKRITIGDSGRGSAWLERLVRDQEVGGSNPLAPTKFLTDLQALNNDIRVQKGSIFGLCFVSTPWTLLHWGCVLIDLQSDDFDDPLGPDPDQEV
jgi:hypothetical protein